MMKAAFFSKYPNIIDYVYNLGRREKIAEMFDLYEKVITPENIAEEIENIKDIDCLFTSWHMFVPEEKYLDQLTNLKVVFYGAGTVKYFAEPFLRRGIQVVTSAQANGEFVADYAASQIQLAAKGFFHNLRVDNYSARDFHGKFKYTGFFEINVGLIGAGMIGRMVIERMKLPSIHVCVYDPYLSEERARELGVKKCSLEEIFSTCLVVSNHAPNIPETEKMLTPEHFASMLPHATFINTGRGATVDEEGMIRVLKERTDIVALLDVTFPEPPAEDSPLLHMPNIYHTSHIAGSQGNEVVFMADLCIEEAQRFLNGQPMKYSVTMEMLKTMA
ncbi:MAG: hydroxyacid dehydrogenase [Clostridiales bacterium]|nr:hydroxyacid dehydrogenase [Clostridiales bacterium]